MQTSDCCRLLSSDIRTRFRDEVRNCNDQETRKLCAITFHFLLALVVCVSLVMGFACVMANDIELSAGKKDVYCRFGIFGVIGLIYFVVIITIYVVKRCWNYYDRIYEQVDV